MKTLTILHLSFLGFLLTSSDCLAADNYYITDLGIGTAEQINGSGVVVGVTNSNKGYSWIPSSPNGIAGTFILLGELDMDHTNSLSYGLNTNGVVVGLALKNDDAIYGSKAFSGSTNGTVTELLIPYGGFDSQDTYAALRVNDSGSIIGQYYLPVDQGTTWSYFRDDQGNYTQLFGIGNSNIWPLSNFAYGINNSNIVVGEASGFVDPDDINGPFFFRAYIWTNNTVVDLGTLHGVDNSTSERSLASAINLSNVIAGYSTTNGNSHACIWTNGTSASILDIHTITNRTFSKANSINISNIVVGTAYNAGNANQAGFIHTPASGMILLDDLIATNSGWTIKTATSINDWGQIVGTGVTNGQTRALLLTPK